MLPGERAKLNSNRIPDGTAVTVPTCLALSGRGTSAVAVGSVTALLAAAHRLKYAEVDSPLRRGATYLWFYDYAILRLRLRELSFQNLPQDVLA